MNKVLQTITFCFCSFFNAFFDRCAIVCSVLGIIGNGLTMAVLVHGNNNSLKKQSTIPFLISLTVSDFIFCAFNLPQGGKVPRNRWPDAIWCVLLSKLMHFREAKIIHI